MIRDQVRILYLLFLWLIYAYFTTEIIQKNYLPLSRWLSVIIFLFVHAMIFFYFLQSDWLQQRAAFYDILTVVQKCYFLKTNQGVELIVQLQ